MFEVRIVMIYLFGTPRVKLDDHTRESTRLQIPGKAHPSYGSGF